VNVLSWHTKTKTQNDSSNISVSGTGRERESRTKQNEAQKATSAGSFRVARGRFVLLVDAAFIRKLLVVGSGCAEQEKRAKNQKKIYSWIKRKR